MLEVKVNEFVAYCVTIKSQFLNTRKKIWEIEEELDYMHENLSALLLHSSIPIEEKIYYNKLMSSAAELGYHLIEVYTEKKFKEEKV